LKRFALLIVILAIPFLLAGCFRPAGDTIEPTQEIEPSAAALVATAATSEVLTTPTLPPITILASSTRPPATETPAEATATRAPQTIVPPPSATPQFITPGSPLGPVQLTTSVPAPLDDTDSAAQGDMVSGETTPTRASTAAPGDECIYVVESGDSLYSIAVDHDTTIEALLEANPDLEGDPPILYPDDELRLPDCGDGVTRAAPTATVTAPTATRAATRVTGTPGAGEVYTVEAGDTVFNIAQRYGLTVAEIVAANPGLNPDRISIGQRIIIPPDED
jgi:LysM repeat protein